MEVTYGNCSFKCIHEYHFKVNEQFTDSSRAVYGEGTYKNARGYKKLTASDFLVDTSYKELVTGTVQRLLDRPRRPYSFWIRLHYDLSSY
jgi:hypothetical protein